MQDIIIIGNSHAARESFHLFMEMRDASDALRCNTRFKGFLAHGDYPGNLKELADLQLGSDTDYRLDSEDHFVIGIADVGLRRAIFEDFRARGAKFYNLISPQAGVSKDAILGEANIIGFGCGFSCNIRIGNANYCNSDNILGHDVIMGDYNFLGPGVMLLGCVRVGDSNRIGARSVLLEGSRVGDHNSVAPASVLYKGCGSHRRVAGNPAIPLD